MEDLKMASMGFPQTQHQQGGSNDSMLRPSSRGSRVQSRSLSRVEKIESEAELLGRKLSGHRWRGETDEGKQHHGHSGSTGVGIGSIEQQNGESVYDGTGVMSANDVDEEQQRRHEEHERGTWVAPTTTQRRARGYRGDTFETFFGFVHEY